MQTTLKPTIILATLLASTVTLTACLHSEDDAAGATVPANAITIDDLNAEAMVQSSVLSTGILDTALGVETTPTLGIRALLNLVKPRIEEIINTTDTSGADPVYGVAFSDSGTCPGSLGGTFSFSGDETGTPGGPETSSATATFVDCDFGFGFIIDGSLSWNDNWNDGTGDYNETASGTIGFIQTGGSTLEIILANMSFAETGNNIAETYTTTVATVSINFSTGGAAGVNGFLVQITDPIVETTGGFASCPESGTVRITGANGTYAEGTYDGANLTISANGIVVGVAAMCYH